jgi:hypothetical protein
MKKEDVRVNRRKRYESSSRDLIKISKIRGRLDPPNPISHEDFHPL